MIIMLQTTDVSPGVPTVSLWHQAECRSDLQKRPLGPFCFSLLFPRFPPSISPTSFYVAQESSFCSLPLWSYGASI